MKRQLIPAACLFALVGHDLSTDYSKERTLRIESNTKVEMETTESSMTINGEPREGRGGFGGGSSTTSRTVVQLDEFLAHEKGAPTHVKRSFESLAGSMEMMMRDEPVTRESESPLDGVTLEIKVTDGDEIEVTAVEASPDSELLEGHLPTLDLDGLLPGEDVEVGASWEVESEAVMAALGLHLESVLFQPAARPEGGEGGGRRGRGGMRGGGGGSIARFLKDAEWETKLEMTADDEDVDGVACAVIEIEFEASGDLPEQERRGGGRRDDDRFGFDLGAELAALEGTFEVALEGKLLVAIEGRHPVSLELEGTLSTEEHTEFTRQDRTMERDTSREYTINRSIQISQEEN